MATLFLSTFQQLEQAEIRYCLMRDGDQIATLDEQQEVDLLVAHDQFQQLQRLLIRLGFVALPSWGHAPHHFFVLYDEMGDQWLKLDVVTEVAYGHPYHIMYTDLATDCLKKRQWRDGIFVPTAECEVITLLLHCVLDKGYFAPHRRQRLQTLCNEVRDEPYLTKLVQRFWQPTMTWPEVVAFIHSENWDGLLAMRQRVSQHLAKNQQLILAARKIKQRSFRKLNNWWHARRPRSITVAILAPDGAGKSTLVAGIQQSFYFPVYTTYMGLYQKNSAKKATTKAPGIGFLSRLAMQWQRYGKARYQQVRRKLVIFDRYTYDALLPARTPLSRLQQWRRWLLAHACPAPDLVIFLDAPGEMLYARKGEHSASILEEQRQFYLSLRSRLPQMVVIDATQNADLVRRRVTAQIWRSYLRRQGGLPADSLVEKAMFDLCVQK